MSFIYIDNNVLLAVLCVVILFFIYYNSKCELHPDEPFMSCCWKGCSDNTCSDDPIDTTRMGELNPFMKNFSARMCPENVLIGGDRRYAQDTSIKQDTDHVALIG